MHSHPCELAKYRYTWGFYFYVQVFLKNRLTGSRKEAITNLSLLCLDVSCKIGNIRNRENWKMIVLKRIK